MEDKLHRKASDYIQFRSSGKMDLMPLSRDRVKLIKLVAKLLEKEQEIIPQKLANEIIQAVVNRMIGFGPIEPYLHDPEVTEIMVNAPDEIYVEKGGEIEPVSASFRDQDHILNVIDRIVSPLGRRVDESSPFVDARLPDGSRLNAVIPPLALRSPVLTIRRFTAEPFSMQRLIELDSMTQAMGVFLEACVQARLNILISGGTGSGKTSTLNALASCIDQKERLVTIEDTAELQVIVPNLVSLESRPPNIEGTGAVSIRTLVRNALRMRPDRIIVGEVRGPEAFDMLQAMNTGHPGSLTTIHANSPADALRRLESMVLMAGLDLPQQSIREAIGNSLNIIVQQERLPGGCRKVVSISEILPDESQGWKRYQVNTREIFSFSRGRLDGEGKIQGQFLVTDLQPECLKRIRESGYLTPNSSGDYARQVHPGGIT